MVWSWVSCDQCGQPAGCGAAVPGCHSPDLAALDALAAGWQVVHRVDGADGPGVAPPLVLAAFAVAPHGLVHLRTRKHTDTHKDAEEKKTEEITGRMQSSVAQREKKLDMHRNRPRATHARAQACHM